MVLSIIQNPSPTLIVGQPGQVSYTDLSYNIVPDISNNFTYVLRTDASSNEFDLFLNSESPPQSFTPNSLFTNTNLTGPAGMAQDSVGNFYVANGQGLPPTISVYTSTGIFTRTITLAAGWIQPRYCGIDPLNNILYVSSESNVGIAGVNLNGSPPPSTNDPTLTIFGVGTPWSNICRQMVWYNGYLYIAIKTGPPGYIIKYNLTTKAYVVLNVESVVISGQPIAIVHNPFYVTGGNNFLYFTTVATLNNSIYAVSEITGTETLTGGTGSATITSVTTFIGSSVWSITIDNTGNLYAAITGDFFSNLCQIARIDITDPDRHNLSYVALSSVGPSLTRSRGLVFDGSLYLYLTDEVNNRVLKTQPKTFIFGGVSSIINGDAYYNSVDGRTTYLYDISNDELVTTFLLNPAECFKKGTKILCENDIYIPIEEIKIGTLVKTYKHGYKKVIKCLHEKLRNTCSPDNSLENSFQNRCNKLYTYSRESNPDLIEDLHLTGGHSLLLDTLTDEQTNNMQQIPWPSKDDYMVEDKYKLLSCFNRELYVSTEQNVEIFHIKLEPPKNANPNYIYGIYANGILAESSGQLTTTLHMTKQNKTKQNKK
jgi:hypothetical protein